MTEETQTQESTEGKDLSDLAAEIYGDEYHGEHNEQAEPEERPHHKTVEAGYEAMQAEDQETAELAERTQELTKQAEEKTKSYASAEPEPDPDSTPQWSNQDLAALSAVQQEALKLQHDKAEWQRMAQEAEAKYGKVSIEELENLDKGRAAQLRRDAQELQQRHNRLTQQANQIATVAQKRSHTSTLKSEFQKMVKAEPELESVEVRSELRNWLIQQGFDANELDSALDHRPLVLAYRTMRQQKPAQPKRTAKVRKGRKQPKREAKTRYVGGLVGSAKTSAEARSRLKETGRIEDAVSLLSLERQGA